jgi:uncharacterized membrane protein YeaQ/YmgE (transglycosylase-associated protein family)
MFAEIIFSPGGLITWIVIGLVAGWLAGKVMKGSGYGILGDIVVGLIGSVVGGFVVGFFVHGSAGFIGSIVVAVIGACLFIALVRVISGRRAI